MEEEFTLKLDPIKGTATISGIPISKVAGLVAILENLTARIEALEAGSPLPTPEPTPTPTKLSGIPFGTPGFFANNPANGFQAAFDGNINTAFDSTTKDYAICGLDFEAVKTIKKIRFYPRPDLAWRANGGRFEHSIDGMSYQLTHVIESPMDGWNEILVNVSARYIRYVSPENGYGNISEIEFYS